MSEKLGRSFYSVSCETLAKKLLGKVLCRDVPTGPTLKARIVETEMYPGGDDKASHSFNGKKTKRNEAMFMQPGTAYVYFTYGMHFCFNISSEEDGGAVLIRALEPVAGVDVMNKNRTAKAKKKSVMKDKQLCNGPAKLCQAFGINKENTNKLDLVEDDDKIWVENGDDLEDDSVQASKRIGIDGAGAESANRLFRFYEKNNECVSVVDKK